MDSLRQDLRFAIRTLARTPALALLSVLTLAIGIGASATLFTWMNAVLLSPLPGTEAPQSLVEIRGTSPSEPFISFSYPDYLELRTARSFAGVVATNEQAASLRVGRESERIWTQLVSGNFFEVLGVAPMLGRAFRPGEDEAPMRDAVVVLGHGLWQRRFGSDPGIVGREVGINGRAFTVIGVAPPEFRGSVIGLSFDAWVPMAMQQQMVAGGDRLQARGHRWLDILGRLAPGTTPEKARAEMEALAASLAREHPETNERVGFAVFTLRQSPQGAVKTLGPVFAVLGVAVGLILLIACANVANLLLARAAGRRREIAVRLAVGASRVRLVRQLLTESLVLALLAGAAGVVLAFWGSGMLLAFVPAADFPVGLELGVDLRALAFALAVSVVTGVLFGLAPALRSSRSDVVHAIKDDGGAVAGGRSRSRLRGGLVVAQVALSLVLLTSAGLLLKSLRAAARLDLGFDSQGVLLGSLDLFGAGYDEERGRTFARALLAAARALPGVESATLARRVPLSFGGTSSTGVRVVGYEPPPSESTWAYYDKVGPRYLETLRIPLLAGRDLAEADDLAAPRVLVVNETMAARYWPGREALGGRVRVNDDWYTVVGVAKDIRYRRLDEPAQPVMYLPLLQSWSDAFTLHLRSTADPLALAPAVRQEVARLDAGVPLHAVRTLEENLKAATLPQRLAGTLVSVFGAIAVLLAAVGLYGVLRNAVVERTREIGIRVALGGERKDVLRLLLVPALRLSAVGVALGAALALGLGRLLSKLLLGVSPSDLPTYAAVGALMMGVTLVATLLPAWGATRLDPALALRKE
jgi:predicted permease